MSTPTLLSLTVEEAVARMVSLDYLPEGFALQDITSAFLEVAQADYENARVGQRELHAIRANVCEARHELALALIAAMEHELERGKDSKLVLSDDSDNIQRVTTESLSEWTGDQFGMGAPEWESWNQNPGPQGVIWENVTIKIYANFQLGCLWDKKLIKKMSFIELALLGKKKLEPNNLGGILIGLSQRKKFPPQRFVEPKDKTAVSKLRRCLMKLTGLADDPFLPFNEADGWRPRFSLIDDQRNADERAKARAQHVSLDEAKDYEHEGDEADEWLRNNE